MGANEIINEIDKDARAESNAVVAEAEKQAGALLKKADEDAQILLDKSKAKAEVEAERIENSSALARIDAKKLTLVASMEVCQEAAQKAKQMLFSKAKDRADYERYLKKSVDSAKGLFGGDYVLHCNKRDAPLLKKFGRVSEEPIECAGGVVVSSPDGKVRADGTFEALYLENEERVINFVQKLL